ncbi:MAG: hypothetical protein ACLP7P_02645 [Rhodomicrobium sp.]
MKKAILSAIAIISCAYMEQVEAAGIQLNCTLRVGNKLALEIKDKNVLKGGRPVTNLDPKSVVVGTRYITFNQAFGTYYNAWRINRNTLKVGFKTVLKPQRLVVLDEAGACANTVTAPREAQKSHSPGWAAALSALRLQ